MMITRLLDIKLPVIQAPMAGVQDTELAAAISNAGGLGSLPCATLGADALQRELTKLQSLTQRPINVNFFCHQPAEIQADEQATWIAALAHFFEERGLEIPSQPAGVSRRPFDERALQVLEKLKPAVVSFHFGLPEPAMVEQIRRWGIKVMSTATTVDEALWLAERGADAVIAQGIEAGGHRGCFLTMDMDTQLATMDLLPRVREAIDLPVVAAGGITNADAVANALKQGAAGVQVGTAFLLCKEARTSELHRRALASKASQNTALTNVFTGRPARGIVNRLVREIGPLTPLAPAFPTAAAALTTLRAAAERSGSDDFTPLWCGQDASGCREIPAAELLKSLVPGDLA